MGDLRKRLVELAASVVRGNYDPTEPPPGRWSRVQKWRDHDAAVGRLKRLGLAIKDIADGEAEATTGALRSIATIIGCPANTDPLTDLDGLVSMVRGLAERAETVRVVTADRDRRIDPVEHARAVMDGFTRALDTQAPDHDKAATLCFCAWCRWDVSDERATLLARVGADVLAEVVER